MVKSPRRLSPRRLAVASLFMALTTVATLLWFVQSSASGATKPLPDASTFETKGTREPNGNCNFNKQPSVLHHPGEGAIEVRPLATYQQTCTQTWERGSPTAEELAAEGASNASSHNESTVEPVAHNAAVARRGKVTARAASTFHHDYVFAREHNGFGEVVNAINVTVEYDASGGSVTNCVSERAKWEWDSLEEWSLGTHNEHEGCASSEVYSSAYALFSNGGSCQPEYNRTAIFGYANGNAAGYGPIYKCYDPPSYAWYITEEG